MNMLTQEKNKHKAQQQSKGEAGWIGVKDVF